MNARDFGVTVVPLDQVNEIPLPNGSWSKMVLTGERVEGIVSSLGYSVIKPGTELSMVSHETEELVFVLSGAGELRQDTTLAAVLIAAVGPGGLTEARYLCRRLRDQHSDAAGGD